MITFDSVTVHYPGAGPPAVRDFSLEVPTGEVTVLLGSSGCGKTTLLRCVNRLVEPTSGTVRIDGAAVGDRDPVALRRSIGYVIQNAGLLPHRTVRDNIGTVPRLTGTRGSGLDERIRHAAELVDLHPELLDRYPRQLSGGQQQRVGVARALAGDPDILLMDEPFGAVDPIVRRDLQDQVGRLQEELGKTVILVTHDVDEAFALGDRVVVLRGGARVAQAGTPEDLMLRPADGFVESFVGGQRRGLQVGTVAGRRVVQDARGRIVGTLDADADADADGAGAAGADADTTPGDRS
ncbi:ABC transporter ATP-binding protein [Corynebacterium bovis]|uniref:ABC transporter ATP-binding protein n=1 Tax=Corynebacterium bovis TaxID=36808 RepID=UPI0031391042